MINFFVTLYRVNFLTAEPFSNNLVTERNLQKRIREPSFLKEKSQMTNLFKNLQKLKESELSIESKFFKEFKIEKFYILRY